MGWMTHQSTILVLLTCLFTAQLMPCWAYTATSVTKLKHEMYKSMSFSRGCYKLLNATGVIGCEEPTGVEVSYPLIALTNLPQKLTAPRVVLVPEARLAELLAAYEEKMDLKQHLKGVLVDPTVTPISFSPAPLFPHADLAPYSNRSHVWNPAGADLIGRYLPFPMYILTPSMAEDARRRTQYNHQQGYKGEVQEAKMNLQMMATNSSVSCLMRGSCNPVGGYSVWAAMPPLPTLPDGNTSSSGLPITLVTAQVDSTGLFHDIVQGAEAPLSGLLALLAALDILKAVNASTTYSRQLVVAAVLGEPWGLMGSRRLMWELERGGRSVQGIDRGLIDQVVEVGPVGMGSSSPGGSTQFFTHIQRGGGYADASQLADTLAAAAAADPALEVSVAPASTGNPGIPPSSLMSILKVNSSVRGVVLADFNTQFHTPFYHSHQDNLTHIEKGSVVKAAVLLARTLHTLAVGNDTLAAASFKANLTAVQAMVDSLSSCLLTQSPGFSCPMVASLMQPGFRIEGGKTNYEVQRYVGVLPFADTRDPLNPAYKADISRFIWNFMAWKTSVGPLGAPCDPIKNVCPAGQVCVGWKQGTKAQGAGKCLNATVRYTPAYSPRVECINCNDPYAFRFVVTNRSLDWEKKYGWPADPIWAESSWPLGVPDLQFLLREDRRVEVAVMVAGCLLTTASLLGALAVKRALEKHLKTS